MSKLHPILQQAIVFSILITSTYVGYLFTNSNHIASTIWISTGFAMAFYVTYRDKYLITILVGIFLGNTISRIFIADEEIYISFFLSVGLTLINFLQIYMIKYFFINVLDQKEVDKKGILLYIPVIAFVSFFGGLIGVSFTGLLNGYDNFFSTILQWAIGDSLGFLIFGNIALLAIYYDKPSEAKKIVEGALFISGFIFLCYALMSGMFPRFQYKDYSYLFMVLFFASAFYFPFRMTLFLSTIFLIMAQFIGAENLSGSSTSSNAFILNIYLLILSNVALFTRTIVYHYHAKNKDLLESNNQLERLIDSTSLLYSLNEADHYDVDSNINYLKNIFQIALTLFDNFEIASCYIRINNKPHFIDAQGYHIELLNKVVFKDKFDWAINTPNHIIIDGEGIENIEKETLNKFHHEIPKLKESIRFGLTIDDEYVGGMSFDIKEGSKQSFSTNDFDQIVSFHRLMNSLFEINYAAYKKSNFKNDIVLSLITTLELYDQYTGGHSEQVASIAECLSKRMGMSKEDRNELYWAAVVHDIGKVGIDSSIINKPGKLTNKEYELIKKHAENGANILSKSEDLKEIATIVLHHHEWWNGKGYPKGLKGDEIPLQSQILAISDAVSAMSDTRPYSPAKSVEEIISELAKSSGTMFNPALSVLMIECLKSGLLDM